MQDKSSQVIGSGLAEAIDLTRAHPADVLRSQPGRWGRVSEHLNANSAASYASRLRAGRYGGNWGAARGEFEATWRNEGGTFALYARYVGQPNGDAR